jgi:hypothetical protein
MLADPGEVVPANRSVEVLRNPAEIIFQPAVAAENRFEIPEAMRPPWEPYLRGQGRPMNRMTEPPEGSADPTRHR